MPLFETPRYMNWKEGVCAALWERVGGAVRSRQRQALCSSFCGAVTVTPDDQTARSQPPWDREVIWSLIFAPASTVNSCDEERPGRQLGASSVTSCTMRLPFKLWAVCPQRKKWNSAAFCQTNFFMEANSGHGSTSNRRNKCDWEEESKYKIRYDLIQSKYSQQELFWIVKVWYDV